MKLTEKQYYRWTWISHLTIDPFVAMVALGAFGHMQDIQFLYSLSYTEVWLVNVALQFLYPIVEDGKKRVSGGM